MLAPMQREFRPDVLALLEPWKRQYDQVRPRYEFLVLRGASRTGKSTLARSLGGTPFVQTVQSALSPDLRGVSLSASRAIKKMSQSLQRLCKYVVEVKGHLK